MVSILVQMFLGMKLRSMATPGKMQGASLVRVLLNAKQFVRFSSNSGYFVSQLPPKHVKSPFADPERAAAAEQRVPQYVEVPVAASYPAEVLIEPGKKAQIAEAFADKEIYNKEPSTSKEQNVEEALKDPLEELNKMEEELRKLKEAPGGGDDATREAEAEKRRKRMEKNTRLGGFILLGSAVVGSIAFALYYGRANRDDAGNVIPDAHTGSLLAPIYRIYDSIWAWRDYVVEPARKVLLPDPLPPPYLQPKYTVVIEMKNILVNPQWTYKTGYRFAKRPALDYFLDVVGYPNFEVVIYTSESAMTAMPVIDSIDPKQRIMFRLFRDCTKYANGHHMKDLDKLNRDLSKVIYIEYDPKAGSLNPENMLRVPEWKGNADDTALVDLAELLKTIHLSDVDDVRPTLQYYSQFDDPAKEFRKRAIYLAEQEAQKEMLQPNNDSFVKRFSGKLFGFRRHQST